MSLTIGVPAETVAGEARVALTPETAKKLIAQGHVVRLQSGAGVAASATDEAYAAAGAEITDRAGAFAADLVLKVRSPQADELGLMKPGTALVAMLDPFNRSGLEALAGALPARSVLVLVQNVHFLPFGPHGTAPRRTTSSHSAGASPGSHSSLNSSA